VNITVTQPSSAGYITLFPADSTQPLASSINFGTGQTRANNAVLALSSDGSGQIAIFSGSGGTVHLIVDINGYFQ
jgi:hypothetical protein